MKCVSESSGKVTKTGSAKLAQLSNELQSPHETRRWCIRLPRVSTPATPSPSPASTPRERPRKSRARWVCGSPPGSLRGVPHPALLNSGHRRDGVHPRPVTHQCSTADHLATWNATVGPSRPTVRGSLARQREGTPSTIPHQPVGPTPANLPRSRAGPV